MRFRLAAGKPPSPQSTASRPDCSQASADRISNDGSTGGIDPGEVLADLVQPNEAASLHQLDLVLEACAT